MAQITEALVDAEMLLGHAARRGLTLSPDCAAAIVALRRVEQPTVEDETRFWIAMSAVAKAVQPVTVASLKAGAEDGAARKAVWRYRRWAYGALAILALMQIYTIVGTKSVADLGALPKDLAEKGYKLSSMLQLQAGKPLNDEFHSLQTDLQFQHARLEASYGMLQLWRLAWHPILALQMVLPSAKVASAETIQLSGQPLNPPKDGAPVAEARTLSAPPAGSQGVVKEYTPAQITEIQLTAEFVLLALQDYALPFLYGLLGACIFILRNLSTEVRSISFVSDEDYQLRLPLGALSGVAIAWFLSVLQSAKGVEGISPLPLAFLAGYSVEILFSALDRLVGAFSLEGSTARRAS